MTDYIRNPSLDAKILKMAAENPNITEEVYDGILAKLPAMEAKDATHVLFGLAENEELNKAGQIDKFVRATEKCLTDDDRLLHNKHCVYSELLGRKNLTEEDIGLITRNAFKTNRHASVASDILAEQIALYQSTPANAAERVYAYAQSLGNDSTMKGRIYAALQYSKLPQDKKEALSDEIKSFTPDVYKDYCTAKRQCVSALVKRNASVRQQSF